VIDVRTPEERRAAVDEAFRTRVAAALARHGVVHRPIDGYVAGFEVSPDADGIERLEAALEDLDVAPRQSLAGLASGHVVVGRIFLRGDPSALPTKPRVALFAVSQLGAAVSDEARARYGDCAVWFVKKELRRAIHLTDRIPEPDAGAAGESVMGALAAAAQAEAASIRARIGKSGAIAFDFHGGATVAQARESFEADGFDVVGWTPSLADLLAQLESAIGRADAEAHGWLAPPASEAQLAQLAAAIGGELPDDLRAWFEWHDGAAELFSIVPPRPVSVMSVAEVLAARRVLLEHGAANPYPPSWLPLLDNGAGYTSYVLSGKRRGALVAYRFAERDRPTDFASLRELVDSALGRWEIAPVRRRLALTRSGEWERRDAVVPRSLDVGSAIACCTLGAGMNLLWHVYVQVEPGRWVWGCATGDAWEPEALAFAARTAGGEEETRLDDLERRLEAELAEIAETIAHPPARAPADLGALGLYVVTVRVATI
jgi:hypothetical protein